MDTYTGPIYLEQTPLVRIFGNSVFLPESWVGDLPEIFQAFLFYPDYYFMAWPFQFIGAFFAPGHPYFNTLPDNGHGNFVVGFAFGHALFGIYFALNGFSRTFEDVAAPPEQPFGQSALATLPNALFRAYWVFWAAMLFWHFIIARVLAAVLINDHTSERYNKIVATVLFGVFLGPPIINIVASTIALPLAIINADVI
jgi:hypothetical protein